MSAILPKTMLRWKLDENNWRTAIQAKAAIIQVKSVVNGKTVSDQKYTTYNYETKQQEEGVAPDWWNGRPKVEIFTDFMTWHASLPQGGSVTIEPPRESQLDKMRPLTGTTDAEKMYYLTKRFDISHPKYNYKQNAYLIVGETVRRVYSDYDISLPIDTRPVYICIEGDHNRYNTFAEIGDCLNAAGKPKITVNYRKKGFSVAHLF